MREMRRWQIEEGYYERTLNARLDAKCLLSKASLQWRQSNGPHHVLVVCMDLNMKLSVVRTFEAVCADVERLF